MCGLIRLIIPLLFTVPCFAYDVVLFYDVPIPQNQNIIVATIYDCEQFSTFISRVYSLSPFLVLNQTFSNLSHVINAHQLAILWAKNRYLQAQIEDHLKLTEESFKRMEAALELQKQARYIVHKKGDDDLYDGGEEE